MPPFETFARDLGHSFGFERFVVVTKDGYLDLQVMVLPERLRGRNVGSQFMRQLCAEADRRKVVIGTCPEPLVAGWIEQDKRRLIRWYERFGFTENLDGDLYAVTYVRIPVERTDPE